MTKEEAIDVLRHNYPSSCFEDLCKAVDIAIKALSAQSEIIRCKDCKYWEKFPSSTFAPDYHHCGFGINTNLHTTTEDYCSRGERKEDAIN